MFKKSWRNLKNKLNAFRFSYEVMKKGNDFMIAMLYAALIVKGTKTFGEVPKPLQEEVKNILLDADLPEFLETKKGEN